MIIDNSLLDKVEEEARRSPRLRMNRNIHESFDDRVQQMINVLIPGTLMPVHRHLHSSETFILLRGKMFVMYYDELGREVERILLDPLAGNYGVNIPKGQWHGVEVIETSAILEVKEGPYTPLTPENILY